MFILSCVSRVFISLYNSFHISLVIVSCETLRMTDQITIAFIISITFAFEVIISIFLFVCYVRQQKRNNF